MKKLRSLFYYTTTGMALGYLLCTLLFFSVSLEMMVGLNLVMYISVGFGIMLGIAYNRINFRYLFFIFEGLVLAISLATGRLINILYITKESLNLDVPVSNIKIGFIIGFIIVNAVNIYIVATLKKYQTVLTKEERKAKKSEEKKLSDLREEKTPEEIAKIKSKRKKQRIIALALIVLSLGIYFVSPKVNNTINHAFAILSQLDTHAVIEYIRSYGSMAAVISFILMILQSVAAPIPAFLITLANASIFGWVKGAILSWSSAMAGAALCFFIARALGRDVVEKLTSRGAMEGIDVFFERYGKYTILVCRLLPFVSFDFVSYAAGLTNMSFWSFFIATGIGQLPATLVYSYVGGTLTGGAQKLFIGLLVLFALSIVIGIMKKVYDDKHKAVKEAEASQSSIDK